MSKKKSTAKEKLLSFTCLKGRFLAGTRLEFSTEDFTELESWSVEDCEKVVKLLRDRPLVADGGLCPWCLVRYEYDDEQNGYVWLDYDNCEGCGFGERHGFCNNLDSAYNRFESEFDRTDNQFGYNSDSVLRYLGAEKIKQLRDCLTEGAKDA